MQKYFIIFFLLIITFSLKSQTKQEADKYYEEATILYQQKDYLQAAELFLKSAEIEKKLTDLSAGDLVLELQNAGICYSLANKRLQAIAILDEVYNIYEKENKLSEQATTLYSIIEIYQELNIEEKDEQIKYIEKVIDLCQKTDKNLELILSYNKLSAIYKDLEQFDKSIINTKKAVTLCSKIDKKQLIAYTYNNHAENLMTFNENDSALYYLNNSYLLYKELVLKNDIAVICNNLGIVNSAIYKYDDALKYNNEAELLFTELNDNRGIGNTINNTGKIYENWGKYDLAIQNYNKAIKLFEKEKDYKGMAIVYNNMGSYYFLTSYYKFAFDNFAQAENIYLQLNDSYGIATVKNNLGRLYHNLGDYNNAISKYREAELLYKKENDIGAIATVYNNIGGVYNSWAQFDTALIYYNKAYNIQLKLDRKSEIAKCLNNTADVYVSWGQYDKAIIKYEESLKIFTELNDIRNIASVNNNIASVNFSWGNYDKAINYNNFALKIYNQLNDLSDKAKINNNLGSIYFTLEEIDKAIKLYDDALIINRELGQKRYIAETLYNLGVAYIDKTEYSKSLIYLEEAVNIIEGLRKTAVGDIRKDFLASQIQVYESIILCNIKNNDIPKAFYYNELSSAKSFAETLNNNNASNIISIVEVQSKMPENTTALVYSTVDNPTLTLISIPNAGLIEAKLNSKTKMVKTFLEDVDIRAKIIQDLTKSEIAEVKQFLKDNEKYKLKINLQSKIFNSFILAYVDLLSKPTLGNNEKLQSLSKALYSLLIKPIEEQLVNAKNIIIVPNGVLGRLPYETLIDENGKYLVDKFDISYVNSLSIKDILDKRNYASYKKDILAIGISDFHNGEKLDFSNIEINKDQINSTRKIANRIAKEGGSLKNIYINLGYGVLNDLPGSFTEIQKIKTLFTNSDTLTNTRATEGRFKYFSNNGDLNKYKIIHISTHGIAVNDIPILSGLVLYQPREEINGEDGYLRIDEISKLNLNTELVNLSACETGAGKIYSGEGVVGLAQSFIIAGANRVVVSQWAVDEEASAKFMEEFYKLVKDENLNYAEAINKVKRRFISGEINLFWKDPIYWAPFTLYGKN